MLDKNKILIFIYLITLCYLFFEITLSEKSIFKFAKNSELIKKKKEQLDENLRKKYRLKNYLDKFQSNKEFRKLIIKEKLFYKEDNEKVILYKLID